MSHNVRLSDDDRSQAMSALGVAFSQGRLDVHEYDRRCQKAAAAQYRHDLDVLFDDLPLMHPQAQGHEVVLYTNQEIAAAHAASRKPRLGIFLLSSLGAFALAIAATDGTFLLIAPAVFVLLYVLKIGPASWHTPSPQQLHRQRLREIKKEEQRQALERRAQRREIQNEISTAAYQAARNVMNRHKR
ncbi:DUF1707 SHOCT-like domain-containing protein [Corynebacterium lowii]|uniref:DUF1707 domain-containing protein n=1 Tax=Corynebacterium lowii TaxID=1544413 RepID=A0A0Q0Z903_9CORY|nr:DUF1707 domain-containing protein [Corynebacterium lowii]KQB86085.1 hypothetical protein Clow_01438 [Corynebacterium lowii]MDP9852557.1 hypothetical protein [Corynebacterium lowii]